MIKNIAVILAVIAALCLVPIYAMAAECAKFDRVKSDVRDWNDKSTIAHANPSATKQYVDRLRVAKDFQKLAASTLAIIALPSKTVIVMVTFDMAGCATGTWIIPQNVFNTLTKSVEI